MLFIILYKHILKLWEVQIRKLTPFLIHSIAIELPRQPVLLLQWHQVAAHPGLAVVQPGILDLQAAQLEGQQSPAAGDDQSGTDATDHIRQSGYHGYHGIRKSAGQLQFPRRLSASE